LGCRKEQQQRGKDREKTPLLWWALLLFLALQRLYFDTGTCLCVGIYLSCFLGQVKLIYAMLIYPA